LYALPLVTPRASYVVRTSLAISGSLPFALIRVVPNGWKWLESDAASAAHLDVLAKELARVNTSTNIGNV
jgi:hypothetical protein